MNLIFKIISIFFTITKNFNCEKTLQRENLTFLQNNMNCFLELKQKIESKLTKMKTMFKITAVRIGSKHILRFSGYPVVSKLLGAVALAVVFAC